MMKVYLPFKSPASGINPISLHHPLEQEQWLSSRKWLILWFSSSNICCSFSQTNSISRSLQFTASSWSELPQIWRWSVGPKHECVGWSCWEGCCFLDEMAQAFYPCFSSISGLYLECLSTRQPGCDQGESKRVEYDWVAPSCLLWTLCYQGKEIP